MLAVKSQGKIVQKVLRTKAGESVLATFFVIESDGGLNVRLLSVRPVENRIANQESRITKQVLCLRGSCAKSPSVAAERRGYSAVVSPFFNKFQFFISQPTRAPSA
ncbi:MAG: hypothetical protein HYV67_00380 [Candidatus Taylorbacteria bacterium]|nr:hypothetical protein [Candidatus Taylorbacteria bacterium]